jgi:urea carboxylase
MFDKVLIANRGAIACRIIRTLRGWGSKSVAVYSEADRHSCTCARPTWRSDRPGAGGAELPRRRARSSKSRSATGAQAIHPGYGFLSENPGFAERCEAAGIAFIGPTPGADARLRPQAHARARWPGAGVPLLPGSGLLA